MIIFIPTRSRIQKMTTIKNLHFNEENYGYKIIIIVPRCEEYLWDKNKYNIRTVPDYFTSGDIRQFIMMEYYKEDRYHFVIDDDLSFSYRMPPFTNLISIDSQHIISMLKWVENQSDNYAFAGISAREGNNHHINSFEENGRIMRCYFYDCQIIIENNLRWDGLRCRMDFYLMLNLLRLGYYSICNYDYAHSQDHSGVTEEKYGGCGYYRTEKLMAEQAYILEEIHKPFVKAIKRTTKTSFGGGERTDVNIQWKKALKKGRRN